MNLELEQNFKLYEVQDGLPNVNLETHKINQDIFVVCANGKYINFIFSSVEMNKFFHAL